MLYTMVANDEDVTKVITTNVTDMSKMFYDSQFNGGISNWDVSNVTNMEGMFIANKIFNQDIGSWDVGNVTNMFEMFWWAKSFNQDISVWDVSNITECEYFSLDATAWTEPKPNFTNCTE